MTTSRCWRRWTGRSEARLLAEDGPDGYRFTHDLIRETVENGLSAARRRRLHRRIGRRWSQPGARAVAGVPLLAKRRGGTAAGYLELAGDQAQRRVAYAAAAEFYAAAAARLEAAGRPAEVVPVTEKKGMAWRRAGRYDAAITALEDALAGYRAADDAEGVARVTGRLAYAHYRRGTSYDALGDAWLPVIGCSPLYVSCPCSDACACHFLALSLPVAAGPGVRTGDSLLVLPAGVHGQTRTRDPDKMPTGAAARMAAPGWAALAWSGPGRFPGEGAGRTMGAGRAGRGRQAQDAPPTCGQLLQRYRVLAGLTQEELAERAGYSGNYIGKLEQDQRELPAAAADRLAAVLGLADQDRAALRAARERRQGGRELPARLLAGRDAEMAQIRQFLAGAGPPVLLLAGEPGMGKTRLLEEAASRAAGGGWGVARGGCLRRAQDAYAPLSGALDDALQRLPDGQRAEALRQAGRVDLLLPELAPPGGPGPGEGGGARGGPAGAAAAAAGLLGRAVAARGGRPGRHPAGPG